MNCFKRKYFKTSKITGLWEHFPPIVKKGKGKKRKVIKLLFTLHLNIWWWIVSIFKFLDLIFISKK